MERHEIYQSIDDELAYQEAHPIEFGLCHLQSPGTKTWDWIGQMEHFTRQAKLRPDGNERLATFRKLAAVCVAAIEQYGCPKRMGNEGELGND